MKNSTVLLMILLSAAITFLLRLTPFALFGGKKELAPVIRYLGKVLPYSIMAVLVVYCLKGIRTGVTADNIFMIVSAAVTAGIHLWKKNTILSIFVGTVCYMILIRL